MLKADLIAYYKTAANTARALNISHVAVGKWGSVVPWGTAHQVEVMTGGALKVRPELYLRRKPVSDTTLRRRLGDSVKTSASVAQ